MRLGPTKVLEVFLDPHPPGYEHCAGNSARYRVAGYDGDVYDWMLERSIRRVAYDIVVEVNSRSFAGEVAKAEDSVNRTMHGFGYVETLRLRTTLPMTMTVERELTDDERAAYTAALVENMERHLPGSDPEVLSFTKRQ